MNRRQIAFWVTLVGFVVLDQLVKLWTRHNLNQGQALPYPFPGIFEIELTYNQGIAFGYFQGKGVLLAPIAVIISAGSIWHAIKHPEESRWNHVGFGLLAAGALGNLFDRLVFQRVTDMLSFRLIHFPVFNVADSCITVATVMLIVGWWVEASKRKDPPAEHQTVQAQ
ncbi:MAG TPA: signal peptidase II [Fimbriimonas sp.]|nr:signal peptidase II [Fimbriimonas sp.]